LGELKVLNRDLHLAWGQKTSKDVTFKMKLEAQVELDVEEGCMLQLGRIEG
jgi:hypothetical protein